MHFDFSNQAQNRLFSEKFRQICKFVNSITHTISPTSDPNLMSIISILIITHWISVVEHRYQGQRSDKDIDRTQREIATLTVYRDWSIIKSIWYEAAEYLWMTHLSIISGRIIDEATCRTCTCYYMLLYVTIRYKLPTDLCVFSCDNAYRFRE